LYFAMERVVGMSLDKHIAAARRVQQLPLEPLEAARRFAGVADALGLAHRRRLLHRDVKPGNILVAADGTMALTDFGLAKALDHASVRLTSKGGGFLGTLHYSSPEQALGDELTPASDLYSLGATIFEAVTGELPLAGKTTEALLASILHGTPRRLRDFIAKPPRDLEAVVDKLLSRDPRERYQDGEELARDLQRIADGEPVHIRRLPLHIRLWRRARKNPVLSGAIAAAAVLLLLSLLLLNVWRRERGTTFVLRHQGSLVQIVEDVGRELGPVWGPPGMLTALVGSEPPAVLPSPGVLQALERARLELPDDPVVPALQSAYVDDPEPAATELLRQGRGLGAKLAYDRLIDAAALVRSDGELAVDLLLYRLYVGRGVANLTAAVARPNDARTDLALASYLRPGAAFPKALLAVLDVVQSADPAVAVAALESELQRAAPERLRVIGQLLWAIAGLRPLAQANVMEFPLAYPARRALHDAGARLGGEPATTSLEAGVPTGLAAQYAAAAQDALARSSDPEALRQVVAATLADIDAAVHPDSPLQGWRAVLQLVQPRERARGPLLDREQRPLAPRLQLSAWLDLLQLQPSREFALRWLPRFDELRRNHAGLPGMVRAAAMLHVLAESPEAPRLVQAWLVEADGDPAAWLLRMRLQLRSGALVEARDDAIVAVQESVAPDATLQHVLRICQESSGAFEAGAIEGLRLMVQQFRDVLENAAAAGGR
jgi:hypothetical protein